MIQIRHTLSRGRISKQLLLKPPKITPSSKKKRGETPHHKQRPLGEHAGCPSTFFDTPPLQASKGQSGAILSNRRGYHRACLKTVLHHSFKHPCQSHHMRPENAGCLCLLSRALSPPLKSPKGVTYNQGLGVGTSPPSQNPQRRYVYPGVRGRHSSPLSEASKTLHI